MNNFSYIQPKSLEDASRELGDNWQTSLPYAGGTDLLGLLKDNIESPQRLVNLKAFDKFNTISYSSGKGLHMGALVTINEIATHPDIKSTYPILNQAASEVASPQLRNIGTVGGNICQRPRCWYFRGEFDCLRKDGDICYAVDGKNKYHCIIGGSSCFIVHPSDMAVALMTLEAKLTVFSGGKHKQVPMDRFFVLPEENVLRENILKPGEIVVDVQIPSPKLNCRNGYVKFKERGAWDFAVVSVGASIEKDGSAIKSGRVVIGGVAPIPWLEKEVSAGLSNLKPTEKNIQQVVDNALVDAEPLEMNAYKLPLTKNLIKRLILELAA